MTKVTLHGKLAQKVGRAEWLLKIKSPAQALKLIEANTKKLLKYLYSEEGINTYYRVIINGKDFTNGEELVAPVKNYDSIDFVPVIQGSGSGGWLAIIGVVLVALIVTAATGGFGGVAAADGVAGTGVLGFVTSGAGGIFASIVLGLGISFIFAGLASLLTKSPSTTNGEASYLFTGALNTVDQGNCVPVCYGMLIVGSQTISTGLTAYNIPFTN